MIIQILAMQINMIQHSNPNFFARESGGGIPEAGNLCTQTEDSKYVHDYLFI